MMVSSATSPLMKFNFEGQFLGFVKDDSVSNYMRLRVLSEEVQVKVPKAVQLAVGLGLQPGESVWVTGTGTFDRHAHTLKLKASQVIPLTERPTQITSTQTAPTQIALAAPTNAMPLVIQPTKSNLKSKPKIKVLVCQKSGCLKRGGRGLCEALDQVLSDRNLQHQVTIERTGCLKCCSSAPSLTIMPGNHRYKDIRIETLPLIVDAIAQHLARHGSGS